MAPADQSGWMDVENRPPGAGPIGVERGAQLKGPDIGLAVDDLIEAGARIRPPQLCRPLRLSSVDRPAARAKGEVEACRIAELELRG